MRYFKISNNRWIKSKFDATKKQVTLYNDDFTILGIGLF